MTGFGVFEYGVLAFMVLGLANSFFDLDFGKILGSERGDDETTDPGVATITDDEGTVSTIDLAMSTDVIGTTGDDTIQADEASALALNVRGEEGDDTINVGFGANVDGGEGDDTINLNITAEALEVENARSGTIDLTEPEDALNIELPDEFEGNVHVVTLTETVTNGSEITTTETMYLTTSESDEAFDPTQFNSIEEEEAAGYTRLAVIGLGSTVDTLDADGNVESTTGAINADPLVVVDAEVTTTTEVLASSDAADDEGDDETEDTGTDDTETDDGAGGEEDDTETEDDSEETDDGAEEEDAGEETGDTGTDPEDEEEDTAVAV